MIKIVTNSKGSGDWIKVADDKGDLWGGHSKLNVYNLANILALAGLEVELVEVDDTALDEGLY